MSRWAIPMVVAAGTILIITSLQEIGLEHLPHQDYFPNSPYKAIVAVQSTTTTTTIAAGLSWVI